MFTDSTWILIAATVEANKMNRWQYGYKLMDNIKNVEIRQTLGVRSINKSINLVWLYGKIRKHRMTTRTMNTNISENREIGRLKNRLSENLEEDTVVVGDNKEGTQDRTKWWNLVLAAATLHKAEEA